VARERGEDTPTELGSSDEEEEEEEVTPPPFSPPLVTLPPFSGITSWQVGITVGICRLKQTWIGIEALADSPQPPCLVPVSSDSRG
jgi:hypothetical protein